MMPATFAQSPLITSCHMAVASSKKTAKWMEQMEYLMSSKFTIHSYFLILFHSLSYSYPISFLFIISNSIKFENSFHEHCIIFDTLNPFSKELETPVTCQFSTVPYQLNTKFMIPPICAYLTLISGNKRKHEMSIYMNVGDDYFKIIA